jgi:hypothetical protein
MATKESFFMLHLAWVEVNQTESRVQEIERSAGWME